MDDDVEDFWMDAELDVEMDVEMDATWAGWLVVLAVGAWVAVGAGLCWIAIALAQIIAG